MEELNVPYEVHGDLRLSGERVVIGSTGTDVILDNGTEPIYMDVEEAEMLIATLRVAISRAVE